jgi:hypothetical protein
MACTFLVGLAYPQSVRTPEAEVNGSYLVSYGAPGDRSSKLMVPQDVFKSINIYYIYFRNDKKNLRGPIACKRSEEMIIHSFFELNAVPHRDCGHLAAKSRP